MAEDIIATCDEIEEEIFRVLTDKFAWDRSRAHMALRTVLARSIRVKLRGTVKNAAILTTTCSGVLRTI